MNRRTGASVLPGWLRGLKVITRRATVEGQRRYRTRVRLDDPPRVLGTVAYCRNENPFLWTEPIER